MEVEVNKRKRAEERCVELELEIVRRKSEYEALEIKFRALQCEKAAMEEQIRALKRGSDEIKEKGNGVDVSVDLDEEVGVFSTPKRKRASTVVTSDSKGSDDDIPISTVKRRQLHGRKHGQVRSAVNDSLEAATAFEVDDVTVTSPKRRLVRLRNCGGKGQEHRSSSQASETKNDRVPNKDVEEDEPEEAVESESEGESLGGFIVSSSDVSESKDASSESKGVSNDDDVNFEEVISTFQRRKDHNTKWEFEADMLAAFGKDPELCMKAVCALFRQQTSGEQICKATFASNSRGFSKFDANRGSNLAEFLTNGDPNSDLKKTVEELEAFDSMAIETCRDLASHYSKQLFEIYKNKEDPLFLPSNDMHVQPLPVDDSDENFKEVISTFQRRKDHSTKWEFEADMLAAFGKDPELCMKAVCALFRQQTPEEQVCKETFVSNSRGFSKFDAYRGSNLAEFLTNGDPNSDLKKTVEELEAFDSMAIETCRDLANRYSKQLFEIYKNKEDPLFLPS